MRRPAVMAGAAVLLLLSAALDAQWLKYPTPGIPRLPDGRANLSAPTPRTADGKPDISGLWRASVNYISDLTRGAKPGDVVMLPATEALVRERRANFSRDDPSASCIPGGVRRSDLVSTAYPMRIVTAPGRVVVLYEAIHGWREIFTDGRPHPPDMNPTWMGYSIGRWMGDDFVVETAGFNDKGWLDNAGHPNTARHHHRRSRCVCEAMDCHAAAPVSGGHGAPRIHLQREQSVFRDRAQEVGTQREAEITEVFDAELQRSQKTKAHMVENNDA